MHNNYSSSKTINTVPVPLENTKRVMKILGSTPPDTALYVYNMGTLSKLYTKWNALFPNVKAHYAVKCNPDKYMISTLAKHGANFDCASQTEISTVLSQGVHPSRIIYANPCKKPSDLAYAFHNSVYVTTFDSACELDKIAATCAGSATDINNVKLILRIYANDPTAQCVLSNKYGATEDEWDGLLAHAKRLSMNVSGISFHIGSGACNPGAFTQAIANSRKLYDKASHEYGFDIGVIDIGGGFSVNNIENMAGAVNRAVSQYFPTQPVNIIAEPGRYFAETTADLYTRVIGVRKRNEQIDYTITESLYGSFNCIIYDHNHPIPHAVDIDSENGTIEIRQQNSPIKTTIYGETCDGIDKICDGIQLPEVKYGDWLLWKNMGAYTIAGACDFNGILFTRPYRVYVDM